MPRKAKQFETVADALRSVERSTARKRRARERHAAEIAAIYDGFDQTLALTIRGKQVNLGAADGELFRGFGRDIGLPDRAIDQTLKELKRQVAKASAIIQPPAAEGPDGFVTRYSEIVSNQCLRILGE